ncbi:hypothetical protein C8A00DRAFT_42357 [Chaetomidium leptoderma]|uniref:MYND-type domain-containing protein n=1 Tax=Chaetomidium leptoderma TaxID=669021 RepID=A0AAN6VNP8_9PEZI|nr:hypothetical protein C8A00DRAFT_42357 [Chaetomidium leptoderma]
MLIAGMIDVILPLSRLDWAIAGTSSSSVVPSGETPPGEGTKHSQWAHWIDSRTADADGLVDEGDMFDDPSDASLTLEKGRMLNPATGVETDYEEVWRSEPIEMVPVLGGGDGMVSCLALRMEAAGAGEGPARGVRRGLVVRLGQYCQAFARDGDSITLERLKWDGEQQTWTRQFRIGNEELPTEIATHLAHETRIDDEVKASVPGGTTNGFSKGDCSAIAMLTPGYANLWQHFYPVGNTPAVCLTQGLPPEKRADILLLGCGDVRNIMFTLHCEGPRQIDITCCDSESTVIARNIILMTLILDDPDGQRNNDHWDIYYHVFLNRACHDLLLERIKKVHALAGSLETWRESEYGKLIRFCDKGTLTRVAEVWAFHISAATEKQSWMKKTFKAAIDSRKRMVGDTSCVMTGQRSATPTGILAAKDINDLYRHFWRHGSLHLDQAARSQATFANPMFVSPDTQLEDVVATARTEFSTWSGTFRERAQENVILRFFIGDVFPFCHTLQHRHVTGSSRAAGWYRGRHNTMDPLVLIEDDYGTDGTAPVSFNVIDTSNLLDHLGGLNLLGAVSPLLDDDASSSLFTETLLVGDHLPTISLLLGLFPVEYWTNTSPSSIGDEEIEERTQHFSRVTWKRPPSSSGQRMDLLHINESAFASLLYQIHLDMFPGEHPASIAMAALNRQSLRRLSLPTNTRASFAALLSMDALLSRIESSSALVMGRNGIQELYLYMHLLGVHSVDTLEDFPGHRVRMGMEPTRGPGLPGWQDMPSSLCLTLKVPRPALREMTDLDPKLVGTVPIQAVVQSSSGDLSSWQNMFSAVQLGFGKLSTGGSRFSNSFELNVKEDAQVPSWVLLLEPRTAITTLGDTDHVYISKDLPNQTGTIVVPSFAKDAFTPNDPTDVDVKTTITANIEPPARKIVSLTARLDLLSDALRSVLRGGKPVHINPVSPCTVTLTIDKTALDITFPLPVLANTLKTRIARASSYIELTATILPNPATHPSATFTCPVLFPPSSSTTTTTTPICWTTPRIHFPSLPTISLSNRTASNLQSFLPTHTGQMFTTREARIRTNPLNTSTQRPKERTRIAMKETLHHLFLQFPGFAGGNNNNNSTERKNATIFALHNTSSPATAAAAGINILIFVSSLRLDLARRTVVLDYGGDQGGRGRTAVVEGGVACVGGAVRVVGAPVSVEMGEEVVCGCGKGVFPAGWAVDNMPPPMWEVVKGACVRAAISPLFASALVESVVPDFGCQVGSGLGEGGDSGLISGCRNCGKQESKEGGGLKACAKCVTVKYCGRACQRADWKRHKKECIAKE